MSFTKGVGLNAVIQLLFVASLAATPVTVTTLDGESVKGDLSTLNSKKVIIQTEAEEKIFAVEDLMLLDLQSTSPLVQNPPRAILFNDGSLMSFEAVLLAEKEFQLTTVSFGEQTVPMNKVQNIRWGAIDEKVSESWADLQSRGARDDLLIFRKEDVLDYVAGSVMKVSNEGVTVNIRGRDLTAPLERVFAVVFAKREVNDAPGLGLIRTTSGDSLKASELSLEENVLTMKLLSGLSLKSELPKIREIDFGGGRIQYLADLPFDESASKAPDEDFPVVWFTARNFPAGSGGRRQLLIDRESYPRGLWLHSGAVVRFRLNREFSEFRAMAGFDQTHIGKMPRFQPKVNLVVEGDGENLFSQEFAWDDSAEQLNIDLSNVRELVIRVESLGVAKGILEHFALGDAQVIK